MFGNNASCPHLADAPMKRQVLGTNADPDHLHDDRHTGVPLGPDVPLMISFIGPQHLRFPAAGRLRSNNSITSRSSSTRIGSKLGSKLISRVNGFACLLFFAYHALRSLFQRNRGFKRGNEQPVLSIEHPSLRLSFALLPVGGPVPSGNRAPPLLDVHLQRKMTTHPPT